MAVFGALNSPFTMGTRVRTWNASNLLMLYGTTIITGLAEDTFLSIRPTEDRFREVKGTMLETNRIYSGVRSFDISFTLKQTSPSNADLSYIANSDELANSGGLWLAIRDLSGISSSPSLSGLSQQLTATTFFASYAYIVSMPEQEFGRKMSNREWKLRTTNNAFAFAGSN